MKYRNSSIKQNTGGGSIRTNPPIFTKPIERSIHPAPWFQQLQLHSGITIRLLKIIDKIISPIPNIVLPVCKIISPISNIVLPFCKIVSPIGNVVLPVCKIISPIPNVAWPVCKIVSPIENVAWPVYKIISPSYLCFSKKNEFFCRIAILVRNYQSVLLESKKTFFLILTHSPREKPIKISVLNQGNRLSGPPGYTY